MPWQNDIQLENETCTENLKCSVKMTKATKKINNLCRSILLLMGASESSEVDSGNNPSSDIPLIRLLWYLASSSTFSLCFFDILPNLTAEEQIVSIRQCIKLIPRHNKQQIRQLESPSVHFLKCHHFIWMSQLCHQWDLQCIRNERY